MTQLLYQNSMCPEQPGSQRGRTCRAATGVSHCNIPWKSAFFLAVALELIHKA